MGDKSRSIQDWERLLEDVEKHKIPVEFLQKLVLRLKSRKQKTINIEKFLRQGLDTETVEIIVGKLLEEYDGTNKHKTTVGENSFIGTNSSLVAPVNIGKGAYVGAGSVITKDVPDESLAVARGKQVIKEDWAKNKK